MLVRRKSLKRNVVLKGVFMVDSEERAFFFFVDLLLA